MVGHSKTRKSVFVDFVKRLLSYMRSEGSFQFGNYDKEVDDLQVVISAILGHSKGVHFTTF